MKINMTFASYETLGFESSLYNLPNLTIWHIVGHSPYFLLYFNTLTTIGEIHQKNLVFPVNYYNLAICEVTLIEIFSTIYLHSKVLDLTVGSRKTSFHFDHFPRVNKYIFQVQYSPERL
jgi:hypothetical protein